MNAQVARELTNKAVEDKLDPELESLYRRIDENASYGMNRVSMLHDAGSPMGEALSAILGDAGFVITTDDNNELVVTW